MLVYAHIIIIYKNYVVAYISCMKESKFHNDLMELMDIIVRVLQSHITRFQLSTPSGSGEGEGETNKQYQDLSVYIK